MTYTWLRLITRVFKKLCLRVAGATGYIGSHIAEQLGKANVKTSALVRNASDGGNSARVSTLAKLKAAGVTIVEGSTSASTDELANILKEYDTIVSAISGAAS